MTRSNTASGGNRPATRSFAADDRGSVALTFALLCVVILGAVGMAVDYSRASSTKAHMQSALDAALLYVAQDVLKGSVPDVSAAVKANFDVNLGKADATIVQVTAQYDSVAHTLAGQATAVVNPHFVSLLGSSTLNVAVQSKVSATGASGCVLALDSAAAGAVSFGGSSNVSLKNCTLYVNSNNFSALSISGSSSLSAYYVGVVGGISGQSKITATNGVQTGTSPYTDPYASLTVPSFSGCTQSNYNVPGGSTLDPGVYCNGLSFSSGGTITLRPGIYFIDRGTFSVNSGVNIQGTGVTIIFTSSTGANWATAAIKGGATINLSGPTTGPTAGIVLFGDPRMPVGTLFKLTGGSSQVFGGAIYLPKGALSYWGNSATTNGCTQIIADTISMTGNSSLSITCSGYGTKDIGKRSLVLVQ